MEELNTPFDYEIEKLNRRIKVLESRRRRFSEGWRESIEEQLGQYSLEDFRSSEDLRKQLVRYCSYDQPSWKAYEMLRGTNSRFLSSNTSDPRREYYGYPNLTVALDYQMDVNPVEQEIKQWFKLWALGRNDAHIDILSHDCSAYGSYGIDFQIKTNKAKIVSAYGRDKVEGSLKHVLGWVADHKPFRGWPYETDEDSYY